MLYFLPISTNFFSYSIPSPPTSLKPAVITTKPRTPFLPHSSATAKQSLLGITKTASSGASGQAVIF